MFLPKSDFVPRMPGDTDMYHCKKCGNRFFHKIPLQIPLVELPLTPVKCPQCGSSSCERDGTLC